MLRLRKNIVTVASPMPKPLLLLLHCIFKKTKIKCVICGSCIAALEDATRASFSRRADAGDTRLAIGPPRPPAGGGDDDDDEEDDDDGGPADDDEAGLPIGSDDV